MWRSTLAILEGRFDDAERLIDEFSGIDDPNARLYGEIQGYTLDGTGALPRDRHEPARSRARPPGRVRLPLPGYSWVLAEVGRSTRRASTSSGSRATTSPASATT